MIYNYYRWEEKELAPFEVAQRNRNESHLKMQSQPMWVPKIEGCLRKAGSLSQGCSCFHKEGRQGRPLEAKRMLLVRNFLCSILTFNKDQMNKNFARATMTNTLLSPNLMSTLTALK